MSRLIVLVQRPYHLTTYEAEAWLRREAEELARIAGVHCVDVTRLASTSLGLGREWDWLLEVHLDAGVDPLQTARHSACAALLADLRLLGMRPAVVLIDHTAKPEGGR